MNEKLKFRLPTAEDAAEYISYRQAFLDAGSSMDGTGPMRRTPDPMEWLAINAQYADPATVPEGKVQSTQFVCERVSDGRIVGMLQVRLALNDFLLHYGGHIGYSVRPAAERVRLMDARAGTGLLPLDGTPKSAHHLPRYERGEPPDDPARGRRIREHRARAERE